jgi:hypothetical protein
MNEAFAPALPNTRLAQLSAGWVSAYRVVWWLLALSGVALLCASLFQPQVHPAIVALRLVKGSIVIPVCWILLRRRRDDPVAALLSLAFLTWTITSSFDFASANLLPMLLDRARFLLFAIALLLFPDGNWAPAWTRRVAAISGAVFLLGIAEGIQLMPTHLFLPFAIACIAAAIAALCARFRTAESQAMRQQLKWVALGLVCGIGLILAARAGAALAAVSPRLHAFPTLWEALFQLGIAVVALGFLISLLRYRLFDAEAAISRSAAFAGLTIALVATFAGTEAAIEWVGQQYLGMGIGNVSAAMAAAVAAVLLNPFHGRISNWAENHFQRDLVLLKRDLPELLEDLGATASSPEIAAAALSRINEAVHATHSALIVPGRGIIGAIGVSLKDARRWSRGPLGTAESLKCCDRNDAVFPIRLQLESPASGEFGWVLLGPRPDGSLYGKEDLGALEVMRSSIRRALVLAAGREAMRKVMRREGRLLRREMAELRNRLADIEANGRAAASESR